MNTFLYPEKIPAGNNRLLRQIVQERHTSSTFLPCQFGYDNHHVFFLLRQLCFDFERTYTIYLISKEINAIRIFRRERIHIDDTSPYSILARFIHIIHQTESMFEECLFQPFYPKVHSDFQFQGALIHTLSRDYLFGQCLWISHNVNGVTILQAVQHFRSKYLAGSIRLPILDGPAVRRRKEKDILLSISLH